MNVALAIDVENDDAAARGDLWGLRALAIYAATTFFLFAVPLIGHVRDAYISQGNDPSVFSWLLIWWPHAIRHGLNPLFTRTVWEPSGFNLAWSTSVPLPALVAAPITYSFGSIAAFNILSLIASPLAAWSAFLFYRFLVRSWWPSLLGGYTFGFSAYLCGQQVCGHIVLTLVFLVPMAALLVARGIAGDIGRRKLVITLAAVLVAQAYISLEVLATMTLAGLMILILGWSFAPQPDRSRIRKVLLPISGAYALAALFLTPLLFAFFSAKMSNGGLWPAYSVDLLNFVLPVPSTALGTLGWMDRLTMPFRLGGSVAEMDGYIGLPLLAIAILYAWRRFREPLGRTLVEFVIIFAILSMGPRLRIDNVLTIGLPFKAILNLPLLDNALPARLMMYTFLALGLITALWLQSAQIGIRAKVAVAAAIVISTLPTPSGRWITRPDSPAFFTDGTYQRYLSHDDNVLAVPFGFRGASMLWHAEAKMSFNLVGGYTGPSTPEFRAFPISRSLVKAATYMPDAVEQMAACLAHYNATAAIVSRADPDASSWERVLAPLSSERQSVGGINYYRLSPSVLAAYRNVAAPEMAQRAAQIAFDSLVLAADSWRALGNAPINLTPALAVEHGWLQESWFIGPNTIPGWSTGGPDQTVDTTMHLRGGAWLGGTPNGDFGVGLEGTYAALEPVIAKYRATASHVYFPYPTDLLAPGATTPEPEAEALLTLVLDKQQLARAAALAHARARGENGLASIRWLNP